MVRAHAQIADHACVTVDIPDVMEARVLRPRRVWKLADSNCSESELRFENVDWSTLANKSVGQALDSFRETLQFLMYAHVPHFMKIESRSNLPWINDECRAAVSAKHAAQGIVSYNEVSDNCTAVL